MPAGATKLIQRCPVAAAMVWWCGQDGKLIELDDPLRDEQADKLASAVGCGCRDTTCAAIFLSPMQQPQQTLSEPDLSQLPPHLKHLFSRASKRDGLAEEYEMLLTSTLEQQVRSMRP